MGIGMASGIGGAVMAPIMALAGCNPPPPPPPIEPLPANAAFDYQIGQDYPVPGGTSVVSRDWFLGAPLADGYSICYVNAFQTQGDDASVDRPDERSNWPADLVLSDLGDDPNWGGEYLIDISTANKRVFAALWLLPMIHECSVKGFDAVEFDNLDSWTRFDETPLAGQVPFGQPEAEEFARIITVLSHNLGLAVAQKNTIEVAPNADAIGFDFAVVEECGRYEECGDFADFFGADIVAIEYTDAGFAEACTSIGAASSVVRRDVLVTAPGSGTYVHDEC